MNLIDKLLEKDYNERISCADESFSEYFNDNDMSKEAFVINRNSNAKSSKKINKFGVGLKASDVKHLLDNIKNNKK